jgi:hypothetical protein
MRGRRRIYDNPVFVGLRCESFWQNTMKSLKISDTDVYVRGAKVIMDERASDLTPTQLQRLIQEKRVEMKNIQESIALCERVLFDAEIREEQRKNKKTVTLLDERGKPYQAVMVP